LIHESVPPGAKVVGSTSLWWALRDTDYRSYFMFFYVTSPNAGRHRSTKIRQSRKWNRRPACWHRPEACATWLHGF